MSDATLERWLAAPRIGWDKSNGVPLRVGRGVLFGTWFPSVYGMWRTSNVFGHAGAFGVLGAADPTRGLSIACVTNGHRGRNELVRDFAPVVSAARKACTAHSPDRTGQRKQTTSWRCCGRRALRSWAAPRRR